MLGTRIATPGATWTFETAPLPPEAQLSQLRVDSNRGLHALYTKTVYPCDPCNLDLYYGYLPHGGSDWSTETVQASKWGDPNDEFATTPSLAIDSNDEPVVAAAFQTRAITGSLLSSSLRWYRRQAGVWCSETIVDRSDGYDGADGTQFTGANPNVILDETGRVHVVFSDIAQWHDGNGWANGVQGQLRHAVRSGVDWTVSMLFHQSGMSTSPQPLYGFDRPRVAVSPDGTRLIGVGTEKVWDTSSIYNSSAVPIVLHTMVLRADISTP